MALYYPGKTITFNGFDITGIKGFVVTGVDISQLPKRNIESYALARQDGEALVSTFFDSRAVTITGAFINTSQAAFELARDTLMSNLQGNQGALILTVNGANRSYLCSLTDNTSFGNFAGGYASVTLHFVSLNPFGYDTSATQLVHVTNLTAATQNFNFACGGTLATQYPIYTVTLGPFVGLASSTSPFTTIQDTLTAGYATFSGTATSGDVLVFDSGSGSLTQNGVAVSFIGHIPTAIPGNQNVTLFDYGSSRQMILDISVVRRYL